ncbi:MAG: hypothetical protein GY866_01880 [Proteobacteria bacterium]|nr:hypothetical protein [Pseudomonadota bacterium]
MESNQTRNHHLIDRLLVGFVLLGSLLILTAVAGNLKSELNMDKSTPDPSLETVE